MTLFMPSPGPQADVQRRGVAATNRHVARIRFEPVALNLYAMRSFRQLDEQTFLVNTINRLMNRPEWDSTAVVVLYDDSDGWYDHVMPPIMSQSVSNLDALTGSGLCGSMTDGAYAGRCGPGPCPTPAEWKSVAFVHSDATDSSPVVGRSFRGRRTVVNTVHAAYGYEILID